MNKINLLNISQKLNINENTIRKISFTPIEDTFEVTPKEQKYIEEITNRLSEIVDYDKMISKLSESKLYGSAFNFIDFTLSETNKIQRVNIGLFNRDAGMVEETSLVPEIFIDIFTNITAKQIQKDPKQEKYYKTAYLKLLNYIEKNKG